MSPCWDGVGGANGLVQMEGKGDPFFPRASFVGRVSGALSVPKSKCLVMLRYSPRADLPLGEIGGGTRGEGKPEAKIKSWHPRPQPAFAALDFSSGKGVLPVPLAGLETGVDGAKGCPTGEPRPHLELH